MKIGIIGAGATGLTAGYELTRRGHCVSIFEKDSDLGGLAATIDIGSARLEKFYHHIFTSDNDFIDLIRELGLIDRLRWIAPNNGMFINGRLYPFTSPMDLLRFRELSLRDRLSLGWMVVQSRRRKEWSDLEKITAREWVIRSAGANVYERFWRPLLAAKFDRDADRVSAVWLWNKIKLRGSTREKSSSGELLGYLDGSFRLVYEKLAEKIVCGGGSVFFDSPVTQILPQGDHSVDVVTPGGRQKFDAVLITAAPAEFVDLWPEEFRRRLNRIQYKANICMIFELRERLSPYYWLSVAQDAFPFVAVIEHTNFMPVEQYGAHVVYLSRYLDESNELYQSDDDRIGQVFSDALVKIFPLFRESGIIRRKVYRARYAQPVIATGYSDIRPGFTTPIRNLYLACMAQIYPEDRGQNYAVRMGKEIADVIHGF